MGALSAPGFPNQHAWDSFFGDENPFKPQDGLKGRRGLPGGPILPKLPRNPFAIKATRIGRARNSPAKWPPKPTCSRQAIVLAPGLDSGQGWDSEQSRGVARWFRFSLAVNWPFRLPVPQ